MKKRLDNAAVFAITYVVLVLPTYLLPYMRVDSSAPYHVDNVGADALSFPFLIHLVSMITLCSICWVRGTIVDKKWLVALPMIAFAFEFIAKLTVIPYVPSMYHVLAIIVGVASTNVLVSKSFSS